MREEDRNITWTRALACLMVVAIHSSAWWGGYHSKDIVQVYITVLTHAAVPLFIMISGSFLFSKDIFSPQSVWKRFSAIFIPLVYFGTIYYIYDAIGGRHYSYSRVFRMPQSTYVHLWYLYMILPIYTLSPLIRFPKLDTFAKSITFTAAAFCVFFATDLSKNAPFLITSNYTIGWMFPFMMLGYGLKSLPWRSYPFYIKYLFLGAYIFALGGCGVALIRLIPNRGYFLDVNSILPVLLASCLFIYIQSLNIETFLLKKWGRGLNRAASFISRYSLGIYGWHLMIIGLLFPFIKRPFGFFASYITVLAVSLAVAMIDAYIWGKATKKIQDFYSRCRIKKAQDL